MVACLLIRISGRNGFVHAPDQRALTQAGVDDHGGAWPVKQLADRCRYPGSNEEIRDSCGGSVVSERCIALYLTPKTLDGGWP